MRFGKVLAEQYRRLVAGSFHLKEPTAYKVKGREQAVMASYVLRVREPTKTWTPFLRVSRCYW